MREHGGQHQHPVELPHSTLDEPASEHAPSWLTARRAIATFMFLVCMSLASLAYGIAQNRAAADKHVKERQQQITQIRQEIAANDARQDRARAVESCTLIADLLAALRTPPDTLQRALIVAKCPARVP